MKLTSTQLNRISQYIKMYEGDKETLQFAWANTWEEEDMEDYYDLRDSDILKCLADLRYIIQTEDFFIKKDREILKDCEAIYQQWILIKGKIK
jgi:hypothetical protein